MSARQRAEQKARDAKHAQVNNGQPGPEQERKDAPEQLVDLYTGEPRSSRPRDE